MTDFPTSTGLHRHAPLPQKKRLGHKINIRNQGPTIFTRLGDCLSSKRSKGLLYLACATASLIPAVRLAGFVSGTIVKLWQRHYNISHPRITEFDLTSERTYIWEHRALKTANFAIALLTIHAGITASPALMGAAIIAGLVRSVFKERVLKGASFLKISRQPKVIALGYLSYAHFFGSPVHLIMGMGLMILQDCGLSNGSKPLHMTVGESLARYATFQLIHAG